MTIFRTEQGNVLETPGGAVSRRARAWSLRRGEGDHAQSTVGIRVFGKTGNDSVVERGEKRPVMERNRQKVGISDLWVDPNSARRDPLFIQERRLLRPENVPLGGDEPAE